MKPDLKLITEIKPVKPSPTSGLDTKEEFNKCRSSLFPLSLLYAVPMNTERLHFKGHLQQWPFHLTTTEILMMGCFLVWMTNQSPLTISDVGSSGCEAIPFIHLYLCWCIWVPLHCVQFKLANEGAGVKGSWRNVPSHVMWKRGLLRDSHANPRLQCRERTHEFLSNKPDWCYYLSIWGCPSNYKRSGQRECSRRNLFQVPKKHICVLWNFIRKM